MTQSTRPDPSQTPDAACERVRGRLDVLHDGGLPPLEEARDRGHLEACRGCASEAAGWEAMLASARFAEQRAAEEEGASDGALEAALAGLDARLDAARPPTATEVAPPSPFREGLRESAGRAWLPLAAAAAAVLVLLALDRGGIGLEGPSRELGAVLLPEIAPSLPSWDGLVEGDPSFDGGEE